MKIISIVLLILPILVSAQSFEKAMEYYNNYEDSLALNEFFKCEHFYLKTKGESDTSYISKIYRCIGEIYSETSEHEKADVYFAKCEKIFTKLKVQNKDYCKLMYSKAMLAYKSNSDDIFYEYKDKAMNCYRAHEFVDSTHLLHAYSEFGRAMFDMGQYVEAIKFCDRSIILHEELFGDTCVKYDYRNALYHKAVSLMNCAEYEYAKKCFEKLTTLYEANLNFDFIYWYSWYNLAYYYAERGQLQKGISLLNKCIDTKTSVLNNDSMLYVQVLNDQGFNYFELKQYDKALEYYYEAEDLTLLMSSHRNLDFNLALLYSNMASVHTKNCKIDSALYYYKRSDKIYALEDVLKDETYIEMLCLYANLLLESGKINEAESIINKAVSNMNSIILSSLYNKSSSDKHFILSNLYDKVSVLNQYVCSSNCSFETANNIYENMLLIKQGMLENTFRISTYGFENKSDQIKQLQLAQTKKALKNKAMLNQTENNVIDSLNELIYIKESELLRTLKKQSSKKITVDLFNTLKDNEAIIDFYFYYDFDFLSRLNIVNYVAFVIGSNSNGLKVTKLFTNEQLLHFTNSIKQSSLAHSPLNKIQDYERIPNLYAYKNDTNLYSLIWEPLDSLLQGVEKVYISPAGDLYNIAFDALPVSATQTLSDKYEIEYVSSAAQVAVKPEPLYFSDSTTAVLFGDMDYNLDTNIVQNNVLAYAKTRGRSDHALQRSGELQALGNYDEIKGINKLFASKNTQTEVFIKEKAIEESFLNMDGKAPEIIHLSTHAEYNSLIEQKSILTDSVWYETSPNPLLRSYLAMSGANTLDEIKSTEVNDGKLTAYEVSLMDLTNTRLATLAACQTGLGDIGNYEGVQGLRRAFKIAGVDYLLLSLWQVPNKQTSELMLEFYSNFIDRKMEVRKAFSSAQKHMKRQYPNNPYFWGGFVMVY